MSGLIGNAQPSFMHGLQDLRLNNPQFQRQSLFVECWSATAPASFKTEWWPKGGGFIGDGGLDVGLLEASWWGKYYPAAGAASRYGFVGVTRDQYGTAVGSVTAKLFRTSDDRLQDTTISNPTTGEFLLNTAYYPDAHYIVAHKSGSPDIDGATQNTLIGT